MMNWNPIRADDTHEHKISNVSDLDFQEVLYQRKAINFDFEYFKMLKKQIAKSAVRL